jgi:diguanylate cyclase (GGDEF)-like protein
MQKRVLVVEDSKFMLHLLREKLQACGVEVVTAASKKEALAVLESGPLPHAAILDLQLPDDDGSLIDYVLAKHIPALILTGSMGEATKKVILQKSVEDYILKEDPKSVDAAITRVGQILHRYDVRVLVVDDSKSEQARVREILESLHVKVEVASDGLEALEKIRSHTYDLVVSDYIMPKMDGLAFVLEVRKQFKKDVLGILILSASERDSVAAQFLKIGANDFLKKPYNPTELKSRVIVNLELLDLFGQIRGLAHRDFLTGAYNRRYFDEAARELLTQSERDQKVLLAMVDIDKFKPINDTHGHDVGDEIIIATVRHIENIMGEHATVARVGGEEFCVLMKEEQFKAARERLEALRLHVETHLFARPGKAPIAYTISIGAYHGVKSSLKKMSKLADENLYHAKNSGRNQVVITSA